MAKERLLRGIGVSPGLVQGPLVYVGVAPGIDPHEAPTQDVAEAVARVDQALAAVAKSLRRRAAITHPDARQMLEATAMMAEDHGLHAAIYGRLSEGVGPTRAVTEAIGQFTTQLEALGGYISQRATDLQDIRGRTIAQLRGLPEPGIPILTEPAILVAEDLAPSQTATLDPQTCLGILTWEGGPTGHTAILAATLGIPAVVQVHGLDSIPHGVEAIFDGDVGEVYIEPDQQLVERLQRRADRRAELVGIGTGPGRTSDGVSIPLRANIGTVAGANEAVAAGAEGVGLFRTEFLFFERDSAPTVEEQTETYQCVLELFRGQNVVVRTLDVGADKPLPFAQVGEEDNPALGRRGLRLSMIRPDLLAGQLQALAHAWNNVGTDSVRLQVMAPMVATAAEAAWFAAKAAEYGLSEAGAMIEVPAAALTSELVCNEVAFVSIGTNDLAQYAMAADRLEGSLAELLDPWQPAILELLRLSCDGAAKAGKPIGVCGEAAADPDLALVLVGLGATSLSMAPGLIPPVRAALAMHSQEQCRALASAALSAPTAAAARAAVLGLANPHLAEIL